MRVVIVDDSLFVRSSVGRLLTVDPRIDFVGSAESGLELVEHWHAWQPDVVILDLAMPGMGGLETLDWIMRSHPRPVVILSTHSQQGAALTFDALDRGAFDFIDKQQYSLVDYRALREVLLERILGAVEGWSQRARAERARPAAAPASGPPAGFALIAVAASLGGPVAVRELLAGLAGLPVPIAIVQHMLPTFVPAFAEHLNARLRLPVRLAADGEPLEPGTAYLAPGGRHLRIAERRGRLFAQLEDDAGSHAHCPAADVLFASCAALLGPRTLAVQMTGMGDDGAAGMAQLAAAGAHTIAQDRSTSAVYSMPSSAIQRGAVREELPLDAIGPRLRGLLAPDSEQRVGAGSLA